MVSLTLTAVIVIAEFTLEESLELARRSLTHWQNPTIDQRRLEKLRKKIANMLARNQRPTEEHLEDLRWLRKSVAWWVERAMQEIPRLKLRIAGLEEQLGGF